MFKTIAHTAIDAVQTSKKLAVDATLEKTSPELAKALNKFVDLQTTYTKEAFDATVKVGTDIGDLLMDKSFYQKSFDAIQSQMKAFLPVKG